MSPWKITVKTQERNDLVRCAKENTEKEEEREEGEKRGKRSLLAQKLNKWQSSSLFQHCKRCHSTTLTSDARKEMK
jgi:hypothetical protein